MAIHTCLWSKKHNQSIKEINTAPFSGSTTSLIINILLILVWSWEADTAATTAHITACMPLWENLIKWVGALLYCTTQYHTLSLNESTNMQSPFTCAHINTITEEIERLHLNILNYSISSVNTVSSDLPVWLEQSPGLTSCHAWRSTDKLLRHSWPCQPWPGSPCSGLSCGRCYWGRWALRCGTRTAGTPQSRWRYRTVKPGCPRCLSPSADSPPLSGALMGQIKNSLVAFNRR